jgi:hypothetical protein
MHPMVWLATRRTSRSHRLGDLAGMQPPDRHLAGLADRDGGNTSVPTALAESASYAYSALPGISPPPSAADQATHR